jgi:hypothetical protein
VRDRCGRIANTELLGERPLPARDTASGTRGVACALARQADEARVEARMLDKTANYQQRDKEGLYRLLRTFDPEVSGLIFWPVIFGMVFILASLVLSIR